MKIFLLIITLINVLLLNACTTVAKTSETAQEAELLKDRRPHNIIVSDTDIETDAYEELNDDNAIKQYCHINVNAYNGAVLLTGEAPTEELKTKIIAAVQVISNVKRVHDHIEITDPSDQASQNNDKAITKTTKKALTQIKSMHDFDPNTIKVITENSVVYLMGLVQRDEGKVVINVTKLQPGIKQIITVFEYLD